MTVLKGRELKDSWTNFTVLNSEPAFYVIYSHYYQYLNFIGAKRNFQDNEIKDSISDIFLYIWENRTKLQAVNNHHNYIITAFLRKLYRKHNLEMDEVGEMNELPSWLTSASVEDLLIQQEVDNSVSQIIQEKVDQLAAKQKQLIYQKFYLGLSYQEIADSQGISINTVYNTIYKATSKLRSLLSKEQQTFLTLAVGLVSAIILFFFTIQ